MDKIKILFLASNPQSTVVLKLDEEIRAITEKLRASEYRDVLELSSIWAVHPDDLLQALNTYEPTIVHFSGHGSEVGEIILTDDNHQIKPVSAEALTSLFSTLKDNICLVVLNACYSQIQASAIAKTIDCVIGMSDTIGDAAAIAFSASFYRAIGFRRSIKEAFDQGITSLLLEGISEENTPQLLSRVGVDPTQIILVHVAQARRVRNKLSADLHSELTGHMQKLDKHEQAQDPHEEVQQHMQSWISLAKNEWIEELQSHKVIDHSLELTSLGITLLDMLT